MVGAKDMMHAPHDVLAHPKNFDELVKYDMLSNPRIRNLDRFYRMVYVVCVLGDKRRSES